MEQATSVDDRHRARHAGSKIRYRHRSTSIEGGRYHAYLAQRHDRHVHEGLLPGRTRYVFTTAARPGPLDVSTPVFFVGCRSNIHGNEQTCSKTKAGKSGRLQSKPQNLRFRRLGKSICPRTHYPQRFGSISAFRGSPLTSLAGTLRPTCPTGPNCNATRKQPWCYVHDDLYSPDVVSLPLTTWSSFPPGTQGKVFLSLNSFCQPCFGLSFPNPAISSTIGLPLCMKSLFFNQ